MKNKTSINKQGNPHGYWEYYYTNGQLCYKGNYVNRKQHGYWKHYWDNTVLILYLNF